MISIIRKELQMLKKEKGAFFRLILLPIILIMLFSSVNGKESSSSDGLTQLIVGFMVMFVFYIMQIMINTFFKEKESGMLARLRSTPIKPLSYLMGMWISSIITTLIQITILLGFGHVVYKLELGDLVSIIPLVISLAICVNGIGLAISFLAGSEYQGMALIQIITIGGTLISGSLIPYSSLPAVAKEIGGLTPQYWAQGALQDIMLKGSNLGNILPNIGVLLIFGAAGLLIALLKFKKFILSASN